MNATHDPHWSALLSALAVPSIALLAVAAAFLQWHLARQKLKLDLFDRRLKVHDAARYLLSTILSSGDSKEADQIRFLQETAHARWLFNPRVDEYLQLLYREAVKLQSLNAAISIERGDPAHAVEKRGRVFHWFTEQYSELNARMDPFLMLGHGLDSGWFRR